MWSSPLVLSGPRAGSSGLQRFRRRHFASDVVLHGCDHGEAVARLDEAGEMPSGEHAVEGRPVLGRSLTGAGDWMNARDHVSRPHGVAEIDAGLDETIVLGEAEAVAGRHVEPAGRMTLRRAGHDAG